METELGTWTDHFSNQKKVMSVWSMEFPEVFIFLIVYFKVQRIDFLMYFLYDFNF